MPRFSIHHYVAAAAVIMTGVAAYAFITSGTDEENRSPLSAYLGFDRADLNFTTAEQTETRLAAATQEREAAVAACMADKGYDYEPVSFETDTGRPPLGSREYAEVYGFGVTTMAFGQSQVGDHLIGYPDTADTDTNPNLATLGNLDPEQRADYIKALTGATIDPDQPITAELLGASTTTTACRANLTEELTEQLAFYDEFGDDIDRLRQQILTDPAVIEHHQHIEDCVTDTGIDYTTADDLYQRWAPALQQIHEQTTSTPPQAETDTGNTPQALPALSAQSRAELLTIQNEETKLAVAVYDCGGTPTETATILTDAANRHEETFITENRARLDAFRNQPTS